MSSQVLQVIRTTLTARGDGDKEIYRIVSQYWTMDGVLLFEFDPIANIPGSPAARSSLDSE